jgi:hypothetical protein
VISAARKRELKDGLVIGAIWFGFFFVAGLMLAGVVVAFLQFIVLI